MMIYYHMNHFNQMPVTPSTALTTHVMKCFEKFVISLLEKEIQPLLDTCQFAYKQNRGTEDAALSIVHLVSISILRILKPMLVFYLLILVLHLIQCRHICF